MKRLFSVMGILLVIGVVCVASKSMAEQVYSANVVGYQKQTPSEGFQILADPFAGASNNVTGAISNALPVGSRVYFFDAASQGYSAISEYAAIFDPVTFQTVTNWTTSVPVSDVDGFWVQLPEGAGTNEYLALGEVPSAANVTNVLMSGMNLVSYPYPVDTAVSNLSIDAAIGDRVYAFNDGTYAVSEYAAIFDPVTFQTVTNWTNPSLEIGMGEGFWYQANSQVDWIESRPYDL